MLKYNIICNVIFILYISYSFCVNDPQNYGRFTLTLSTILICKGPKRIECSHNSAKLENGGIMVLTLDVKKNVIPTRGKIVIMINGQLLVRLQMKKPCDHLFLKPVFQKLLNVTQECEFKKGTYILNVDVENLAQKYYGGNFFYGNLTFKTLLYNDECNFFCVEEEVKLSPKKSS